MSYPKSSAVAAGSPTAASQYNNLRLDVIRLGDASFSSCGRLTLTSGSPITTADVSSAGTVYFTPYMGNQISLYNTTELGWEVYDFTEVNISLGGIASGKNVDIFLYDFTGTLTLEAVQWSSDTARATAIVLQNGIYVQSGAANKRYLGTVRTTGTGSTEDTLLNRMVYNHLMRIRKNMYKEDTTASWTYNSTTWRASNNSAANAVSWVTGVIDDFFHATFDNTAALTSGNPIIGISLNAATPTGHAETANSMTALSVTYTGVPRLGLNTVTMYERCATAANATFYGSPVANVYTCHINASVFC